MCTRFHPLWAAGLILVGGTSDALACSICITALADSVLPPIGLWVLLAMSWFVAGGAVRTFTQIRLPWQPPLLGSILLAIGLWVFGAALIGLFVVLLLFVPPIRGFVAALEPSPSAERTRGVRATRIVGWVHVCGVLCATALMVHTHLTRHKNNRRPLHSETIQGDQRAALSGCTERRDPVSADY